MKCDNCANYLSGLDRCKFCSFEEDKSADHRLDAFRHLCESVMYQRLFGHGFHPNVVRVGNPRGFYECEYEFDNKKGDNMIEDVKIKYDNVTVNGVKAKSFSLNAKDNEVVVEWEEDFNLRELIECDGINGGVNSRMDRFGVDYVDSFFDRDYDILFIRTDDISNTNRDKVKKCFECDMEDFNRLSDVKHSLFTEWTGSGWFTIKVRDDEDKC